MANQVAARLAGDDYQHLVTWHALLELLIPMYHLQSVTVEDPDAGSVDDVTKIYGADGSRPNQFLQVKYHVDHRSQYSTEAFLEAKGKRRSLLQKFYETWRSLRGRQDRPVELWLVTNWTWDPSDSVRGCIRGADNGLSDTFFTAPRDADIGKARQRWIDHLAISEEQFQQFARLLRLRLGFDCGDELEQRVVERMMHLGLRHDRAAVFTGVGIVRDIIKVRRPALTRQDVESLLGAHGLYLPRGAEAATVIYLSTVKQQRFEVEPDFLLDWLTYFVGDDQKRGHRVLDATAWDAKMLPELRVLEQRLNTSSSTRLVRARGLARLSAWFAFGHTFSEVARYTIEIDQQGKHWRTDEVPSALAVVEEGREPIAGGDQAAVAVGISVTGSLVDDVCIHLRETGNAAAVLFLRPDRQLGRECFSSGADVTAFARAAKEQMRAFVKEHRARRLLLYYFGPLSGACFLGHQLNAVASEIQIMEDQQPGYAPAFLLT